MKTKLELKDIACYLPHKLKCRTDDYNLAEICSVNLSDMNAGIGIWDGTEDCFDLCNISRIQPILRPLSDLYKPCIDGKTPLLELAKIAFKEHKNFSLRGDKVELLSGDIPLYAFYFNADDASFRTKYLLTLSFGS